MQKVRFSKQEFNQLDGGAILMATSYGNDLYKTLFKDFRLTPEELSDYLVYCQQKGIVVSEKDQLGKDFSNNFILDYLWSDESKHANNTELFVFHELQFKIAIVE